jgi:hypothetical protein
MTPEMMEGVLGGGRGHNAEVLEVYVERVLVPALRHGQVVVADALAARKGEEARELVEGTAASCSSCRRTRPTTIPSRRRSHR